MTNYDEQETLAWWADQMRLIISTGAVPDRFLVSTNRIIARLEPPITLEQKRDQVFKTWSGWTASEVAEVAVMFLTESQMDEILASVRKEEE